MKTTQNNEPSLTEILEKILHDANGGPMSLRTICHYLSGRGYGALITLFSFPFCLPVTIPGLSTPFGLLLAFLGLRVAFAKKPWWPKWIMDKEVSYATLQKVIGKTIAVARTLQKALKPRLSMLVNQPLIHRMHGLLIFLLASLLSLPLPIPMTNMLTAIPICCLGLGLLEDDGVAVIAAYLLAIVCFFAFGAIFYLGIFSLQKAFSL